MTRGTRFAVLLIITAARIAAAEPSGAGAGGLGPKPYELGGYLETKVTHYALNREGAFYQVRFADQPQRGTLDRTSAALRLTGRAHAGEWFLSFRTLSEVDNDQLVHESENRFDELIASWKPRPDFTLDAGKMVLKWGKGYIWNPVAFVQRPKDPNDPRVPLDGYTLVSATVRRNFPGALQSVAFTPLLLPVSESVNNDFGRHGHVNVAGRLQLLYRATDIDLYFLNNGSRSARFGADFSHEITDELELYGEWARIGAHDFRLATNTETVFTRREAVTSYLAGARYQTRTGTSLIVELHHNGTGFSADEFRDFIALVDKAVQQGAGSGLMNRAQKLADSDFGRVKPLRNYLYVRASKSMPPFTPSIRATVNLQDRSYSITPELLYNIRARWELRARVTLFGGGPGTEYGEKYYSRRAELRLQFRF